MTDAQPLSRGSLRTAVVGIATRQAVLEYLRYVGLIMFILLVTAWTIDLAQTLPRIRADATARDMSVSGIALPYLLYRAADMVTRMLPMACFFGVFLAEIMRRNRLETIILSASGASPFRQLWAVVIFAVLLGPLQWQLANTWRPAAIAAQVDLGHGSYAIRFRRDWTWTHRWMVSGDVAIRAEVLRDDPPAMRDILIFTGITAPQLETVYSARQATPGSNPFEWVLQDGATWQAARGIESGKPFDRLTLTLDLIPEQISYFQMDAFFIPTAPLRKIATMRDAPGAAIADVGIWRRMTAWSLPGTFALLAFCLANAGFKGRDPDIPKLIALACFGYVSVVSVKVFWALGQIGVLSAPVAVLATVGGVLCIAAALLWRQT